MAKKNSNQLLFIEKKIKEIIQNPTHYKSLRKPLQNWRRVHIDDSFVLVFSIDKNNKTVYFRDFDHHDKIYED